VVEDTDTEQEEARQEATKNKMKIWNHMRGNQTRDQQIEEERNKMEEDREKMETSRD